MIRLDIEHLTGKEAIELARARTQDMAAGLKAPDLEKAEEPRSRGMSQPGVLPCCHQAVDIRVKVTG